MEQSIYMTTGELAKLMGITKETLFHYDEINLFCPALVTENGYRYYTVNQIELLDAILLLRELGMPLKEIRELLGSRSPEKMIEVFSAREERIRKEMTKLKNMKRWIARHKEKIETGLTVSADEIRVQKLPERYYLYSMIEGNDEGEFYKKANAMVTKFLEKNPVFKSDYEIAYIQHGKDVEHGIYDQYDNTIVLLEKRPQKLAYKILSAGTYLTAYHIGHWKNIGGAYERLISYAKSNKIAVEDQYIERYLIDALTVENLNAYVTEITVRIKDSGE